MDKQAILDAIEKATPKPPRVHELGGGIYYTCYWMPCNESIHCWQRYCPSCGQNNAEVYEVDGVYWLAFDTDYPLGRNDWQE